MDALVHTPLSLLRGAFASSLADCLKYKFSMMQATARPIDITPEFAEAAGDALLSMSSPHFPNDIDSNMNARLTSSDADPSVQEAITNARRKWFHLFKIYGTHFISELTVGGKVIYTRCEYPAWEAASQHNSCVQLTPPVA